MKRYSEAKINKVKALIAKGLTTDEISRRTKVKPFSIAYYRKMTTRPKTTKTTTTPTINALHSLVKNFLVELEQIRT